MDLYLLFFATGALGMVAMALLGVAGGHGARGHQSGARAHGATPHSHAANAGGHAVAAHSITHLAGAGRGATGARVAGAKFSGARANGARANGARANGARANGARANGARANGARANGARANGARGGRAVAGVRGGWKDALSSWLSPRVLLTLALGIGATGLLLAPFVQSDLLRAICSIAGGLFLEKALVAPLWSVLMRFGSAPARTLESALLEEAVALTAFDSQGCGLVSITLDGHEMRALARLKPDEDGARPRIKSGDVLLVESVDAARGQCVVSRLES